MRMALGLKSGSIIQSLLLDTLMARQTLSGAHLLALTITVYTFVLSSITVLRDRCVQPVQAVFLCKNFMEKAPACVQFHSSA